LGLLSKNVSLVNREVDLPKQSLLGEWLYEKEEILNQCLIDLQLKYLIKRRVWKITLSGGRT
jgi:hypothetical protein